MGSGSSSYQKYHYKYDGTTWTKLDDLPYSFYEGSAVVYNNEIHLLGSSYSGNYKSHYEYNGTTWTQLDVLPYDFYRGCAVIYNNEIHIMGSNSSSYYTEHYSFIITKDKLLSFTINKNITIPFVDIDDECSSTTSTYSSSKISTTIDNTLSESKTYTDTKIDNLSQSKASINDNQSSTTSTYSSSKINNLLNGKLSSNSILDIANGGTGYNTITDTIYSTARYRASSLNSSEKTPTINGVIAWTYE